MQYHRIRIAGTFVLFYRVDACVQYEVLVGSSFKLHLFAFTTTVLTVTVISLSSSQLVVMRIFQINNELWWCDDFTNVKVLGMAKQCKITIVDFGFARALCPSDVGEDIGLKKVQDETENTTKESNKRMKKISYMKCNIDEPLVDVSLDKSGSKKSRGRQRDDLGDSSISQKKIRDLSALGTRRLVL